MEWFAAAFFTYTDGGFRGYVHIIGRGEASDNNALDRNDITESDASPQRPVGTEPGSLGAIIQNFKSVSTRKINQARCVRGLPVWQRNYYERIIRDNIELQKTAAYIRDNPSRWVEDREHPG